MKKIIPLIFILFIAYGLKNENNLLIPQNALRFRIIANSNDLIDQQQKIQVKQIIQEDINNLVIKAHNVNEAKNLITQNLSTIRQHVTNINPDNKVNFGQNYFPEKTYKGVTYPAGFYDSLVITLGDGLGQNWWCVMFPPLCLLDATNKDKSQIEYKLYINEVINKYLS